MATMDRRDFYVSHHPADLAWAEWIGWTLEHHGYSVVIQDWDLKPGENLVARKNEVLERCHRTLAIVTPAYLASPVCADDWTAAFLQDPDERERLICVQIEQGSLPPLLRARVPIQLAGLARDQAVHALLSGVEPGGARPLSAPAFPGYSDSGVAHRPRFPAELPSIFRVPPRNANFTGRLRHLRHLADQLASSATVVQATLYGLGGTGKSQIAIEYAHRYATSYDLIWWVDAEQSAVRHAGLAALAAELGVGMAGNQHGQIEALYSELKRRRRWLIVFDNAEEPEDLYPLPTGGHVLITSRNPNWGGVATPISVGVLLPAEAMAFLVKRLRRDDAEHFAELAEELDHLPLALEQAAAYIEAAQIRVRDYLGLVRTSARDAFPARPPLGYSRTVVDTWMLSLDRIESVSADGYRLLVFCAFLGPDGIPRALLGTHAADLPAALAEVAADTPRYYAAVAALRQYSMINATPDKLSVHRLVQWVVRRRTEGSAWPPRQVVAEVLQWLLKTFPAVSGERANSALCDQLLPHVLAVRTFAAEYGAPQLDLALLLERAAVFLHFEARLAVAHELFSAAWAYWQQRSPTDPHALRLRLAYARLLHDVGHIAEAEAAFRTLEAQADAEPGPTFLSTILIDHARLLQEEGQLAEAKQLVEEAISLLPPADAPAEIMARARGILGRVHQDLGEISEAEQAYQQSLALTVKAFDGADTRVALRRNNLAGALHLAGRLGDAADQLWRALASLEGTYGSDHDRTVAIRINLGAVLHDIGQYQEARAQYRQAARVCARLALSYDPRVAMIETGLGALYQDEGDLAAALVQHKAARALGTEMYEPGHPRLVVIGSNAGACLERVGALEQAADMVREALTAATALYGNHHPRVAAVRNIWGVLLGRQGSCEAGWLELEQALEDSVRVYGSQHSRVAVIHNNLGYLAQMSGSFDKARAHLRAAVGAADVSYGPNHPRTATIKANREVCEGSGPACGNTTALKPLFIPIHIYQQATTIDR